jgi:hypothetical protein
MSAFMPVEGFLRISKDGQDLGEIEIEQLKSMVGKGEILPSDFAWSEEDQAWLRLFEFEESNRVIYSAFSLLSGEERLQKAKDFMNEAKKTMTTARRIFGIAEGILNHAQEAKTEEKETLDDEADQLLSIIKDAKKSTFDISDLIMETSLDESDELDNILMFLKKIKKLSKAEAILITRAMMQQCPGEKSWFCGDSCNLKYLPALTQQVAPHLVG